MNPLERRRSVLASRSWSIREKSTAVRRRGRRPVLEDLESRRLLSGISEFPIPTANVLPTDIAAGPDGNLWFTQSIGDEIGMINPTTHVVTEIPLPNSVGFMGADLVSITAGPDGNMWFSDYDGNTIGMINPKTDAISVFPVPTPNAGLEDITTGPDGNLWFTEKAANQVGMINPTTDAITEFPVPTANAWLGDITAGPDGNLWFTEQVGNAIGMINPTTDAITEYQIPTAGAAPSAIAVGPDGNLWFTEYGAIGMMNSTTHAITQFPVPAGSPGGLLADGTITSGPDGNLWFGYFNGDEVGMINPTTDAITVYPVPLAQSGLNGIGGPAAITVGPDGNMWITLTNANEIGVFNPKTVTAAPEEPTPPLPPLEPVTPTPPVKPGMPFGFTVTLPDSPGQSDGAASDTVTVALVNDPGGATLTVTTQNGVATYSGLTLKKLDNRSGYELISHAAGQTTKPEGPADVAPTRSIRIATEEILTAGKGKDKHVVGLEIDIAKVLDLKGARHVANRTVTRTARQAGKTVAQPVSLLIDYNSPAGSASLTLTGKATISRGGQIVVVART
jgi:streptogramin lyase